MDTRPKGKLKITQVHRLPRLCWILPSRVHLVELNSLLDKLLIEK